VATDGRGTRRADSREDAVEEVAEAEVRVGDHVYPSSAQAARRDRTTLVILVRSRNSRNPAPPDP
jgi:hypothetical protein